MARARVGTMPGSFVSSDSVAALRTTRPSRRSPAPGDDPTGEAGSLAPPSLVGDVGSAVEGASGVPATNAAATIDGAALGAGSKGGGGPWAPAFAPMTARITAATAAAVIFAAIGSQMEK